MKAVYEYTVCRRLQNSGLLSFRAAKKPFVSLKNLKARIKFANAYRHWTLLGFFVCQYGDAVKRFFQLFL